MVNKDNKKTLLFGVHCHQPLGNSPEIIEKIYKSSYLPLLKILNEFPDMKITLHISGFLFLYLKEKHHEYISLLKNLTVRRQIEWIVSGFYEPCLPAIPEEDRISQLRIAKRYIQKEFKQKPIGLWLTERTYETNIIRSLIKTGIKYIVVDDALFRKIGKDEKELTGYYLTEENGKFIGVFPISMRLRYLIPFQPIEELFKWADSLPQGSETALVFFDDIEKFGAWPNTYNWVYEKGWLREFFSSAPEKFHPVTYGEYFRKYPPSGIIYLPSGSYFEMGEWSLLNKGIEKYRRIINKLPESKNIVSGGIWRNFFVKYPESNRMHKKMLYLSKRLKKEEKEHLWRAQCNDAYWHGVFGGLYLPSLRQAVYRELLLSERKLPDKIAFFDIDGDGRKEIYARKGKWVLQISPHKGGSFYELSSLEQAYCFSNTITRRQEHYHFERVENEKNRVVSIHEISRTIPADKRNYVFYDPHLRLPYEEWFFENDPEFHNHHQGKWKTEHLLNKPLKFEQSGENILLFRKNLFKRKILIEKEISSSTSFEISKFYWVMEFNLLFPSVGSTESVVIIDGKECGNFRDSIRKENIQEITFKDEVLKNRISISLSMPFSLFIYPIFTLSQSEQGFDLLCQGHCILLKRFINEEKIKWNFGIT